MIVDDHQRVPDIHQIVLTGFDYDRTWFMTDQLTYQEGSYTNLATPTLSQAKIKITEETYPNKAPDNPFVR